MNKKPTLRTLLPWLAAAAALIGVWFLPLPQSIFGTEQLSATNMPQTRATAEAAITDFQHAKREYYDFIQNHDLATISSTVRSAIASAKTDPSSPVKLAGVRDPATQIRDYTSKLYAYGAAGDKLFPQLRYYDDQLMGYTRSATPPTDQVRALTYPLADLMRLYPPPVGDLMVDPPWIHADVIQGQLNSINGHIAALDPNAQANAQAKTATPQTLDGLTQDINQIWESGRSVEQVGLDHTKYIDRLETYDSKLQEVIKNGEASSLSTGRRALAMGLNVLVGLLLAGGLGFLLLPRLMHRGANAA